MNDDAVMDRPIDDLPKDPPKEQSTESVKVASLVEKLAAWVEAQPEYPYLFLADRGRRKRAASIVAKRLLLIPAIEPDPKGVDRETYRKQSRAVNHMVGGYKAKMSKREERIWREARKTRARYAGLSLERAHELALRFNEEFDRRAALLVEMQAAVDEGSPYEGEGFEYAEAEDGSGSADAVGDAGDGPAVGGAGDQA
jgi:hypothetical protein